MKKKKEMVSHTGELSNPREATVENDSNQETVFIAHDGSQQTISIHAPTPSPQTPTGIASISSPDLSKKPSHRKPQTRSENTDFGTATNNHRKLVICSENTDFRMTTTSESEKLSRQDHQSKPQSDLKLYNNTNNSGHVQVYAEEKRSRSKATRVKSSRPCSSSSSSARPSTKPFTAESLHGQQFASTTPLTSPQTREASLSSREESPETPTPTSALVVSTHRCGACHVPCASKEESKRHMEAVHGSVETPYGCDVCSLVFPFKSSLLTHLKTAHWLANRTCQICGKSFGAQRYLLTHLMRHAGVKKFQCSVCGRRFFEQHKLKFHMELHKAESERQLPYSCQLCGKKFANKASWSDHCNTHSGDRPFGCDVCGAHFSHRVGLRRHKLTHEKVKPFACDLCKRTFAVKPKLEQHMTIHTGMSKHVCCHCSKAFTTSSSVKRHQAICPEAVTAAKQDSRTADPAQTSASPDSAETEALEEMGYMCGECHACFPTFAEAEQHTLIHVPQQCEVPASGQAPVEERVDSFESVTRQTAVSVDVTDSSESDSRQQVGGNSSVVFSEAVPSETSSAEAVTKLPGEYLCQTLQSTDTLTSLSQETLGKSVLNSSTAASEQTALFYELVKDTRSSEISVNQTLQANTPSDSQGVVNVHQRTDAEKCVTLPSNQAHNSCASVCSGESQSLLNHSHGDHVGFMGPVDAQTSKEHSAVTVEEMEAGSCEGVRGTTLPAGERLSMVDVEEQTQLAANTLACLSSM